MLEQASQSSLDHYSKLIKGFYVLYGQQCWPLIYQTEARWRREQILRLKQHGEEQLAKVIADGKSPEAAADASGYNPDKPSGSTAPTKRIAPMMTRDGGSASSKTIDCS